ncbi:hypothetical protein HX910_000772 [Salmonella enterica]|nr:hypothetical protein [Salmonella enterica]EFP4633800.1 hypothetical protein [Salmonella enterica]EFS0362260.1 hypothetical protein [Salmonella enterica]EGK1504570.1 hypothetical protein [Salmonella enterica]
MVSVTDDYLFCEPLLTAHLRERIPELVCVGSVAGLEQLAAGNIPAPSAWVFYLGEQISGTPAAVGGVQNRQQFVTQLWAVVVAVYFADGPGRGGDIAGQAGPLLAKVLEAFKGWQPAAEIPRIRRSTQQLPAQYEDGYGFYPLVYQIQIPASLGGY